MENRTITKMPYKRIKKLSRHMVCLCLDTPLTSCVLHYVRVIAVEKHNGSFWLVVLFPTWCDSKNCTIQRKFAMARRTVLLTHPYLNPV